MNGWRLFIHPLLYIILVASTLMLTGCGSSSEEAAQVLSVSVVDSTDVAAVGPLSGAVVQLNDDVAGRKTTGSTGKVEFQVPSGSVNDIHVFGPAGYSWQSDFDTRSKDLRVSVWKAASGEPPSASESSCLKLEGTLSNLNAGSNYYYELGTWEVNESGYGYSMGRGTLSVSGNSYSLRRGSRRQWAHRTLRM